MFNFGKLFVYYCKFNKNTTKNSGGAINNQEGDLKVIDTLFVKNSAKKGGAIRNYNNKKKNEIRKLHF